MLILKRAFRKMFEEVYLPPHLSAYLSGKKEIRILPLTTLWLLCSFVLLCVGTSTVQAADPADSRNGDRISRGSRFQDAYTDCSHNPDDPRCGYPGTGSRISSGGR